MDGFHAKTPSISESRKAAQWLLEKEITAMDLGAIYDELKGFSITSLDALFPAGIVPIQTFWKA
jgi:hypothetical protein